MIETTKENTMRRSRDRLDRLMALGDVGRCLELLHAMKGLIEARLQHEAKGRHRSERKAA